MKLIDANLLLYAVNSDAPLHRRAKRWLEDTLSGDQTVAFSWNVLLAFLRFTTGFGLFRRPLSPETAFEVLASWLAQPASTLIRPDPRHLAIPRELGQPLGAAGSLTTDAHLAALAIEHGEERCSCDGDFASFPGLDWTKPLT